MKIRREILFFVLCLTSLSVWNLLFFAYRLVPGNIWTVISLLSLFSWVYFAIKLINDFTFESLYLKYMFILLMVYNFIIIIRGLPHNYEELKSTLQNGVLFWPYILPFFIFFNKGLDTLAHLFKVFYYLAIAFLVITLCLPSLIMNRPTAEPFIHPFAFGAGFLLMNAKYIARKKAFICLLVCMVAVLSFTYLARRNAIITFAGFMMASLFLYVKDVTLGKLIKLFPVVTVLIILAVVFSDKIPASFTNRIADRALDDTRSGVFDSFFTGMRDDWVFGKGMNGTYYCPFSDTDLDDGTSFSAIEYRYLIETGYLQLILNGGYVEATLFVLILLPAAFLGVFRSSNSLARSCGMIISLWLIDMAIYGLPDLKIQYVCVWICVGLCYKASFRNIPEEDVYEAFNKIGLA